MNRTKEIAKSLPACGACEAADCRGECTIPEHEAEIDRIRAGGAVDPWTTPKAAIECHEAIIADLADD